MPKYYDLATIETPAYGEAADWAEIMARYAAGEEGYWDPPSPDEIAAQPLALDIAGPGFEAAVGQDCYLWRILDLCLAKFHGNAAYKWQPQYQRRGTCVGQGHKLGADIVMAVAWFTAHQAFPGRAAVAPIYAGSRVEVSGRPGLWDGSNGYAAAKWLKEYGVVTLAELELQDDATTEDERLAVAWTASRAGVPEKFETMARVRPILETPLVTTAQEAAAFIQAGAPVIQCSRRIPNGKQDADGIARVSGGGGHCTAFTAVRWLKSGRSAFLYQNSWSASFGSGTRYPDDQPPGSVWIMDDDAESMLRAKDSHALIGIRGTGQLPADDLFLVA